MPTNTATIKIAIDVDGKTGVATVKQIGSASREAGEKGEKAFRKSKKSLNDFNRTATISTGLVRKMVAAFGAWQAIRFGNDIFETGKNIRSLNRAIVEITGSSAAAAAEFEFVRRSADDLGQNYYALIDSYKSLLASSRDTVLEGQATRDIFYGVTKASATLGLSTEQTGGALNAISQMMSKGTVQAEELRGQLGERLPGAFNLAAEAMGISTSELNDMLDRGEVLASDLLPRLARVLDEKYSGEVEASVRATNVFNESWTDLKASMAESGFLESISESMTDIATTFKDENFKRAMEDFARNIGSIVKNMAGISKYAGLRSVIGTIEQAKELRSQGLLDWNEFVNKGFVDRQRMVDDILSKQRMIIDNLYAFKNGPMAAPALQSRNDSGGALPGLSTPTPVPDVHLTSPTELGTPGVERAITQQAEYSHKLVESIELQNALAETIEDTYDLDVGPDSFTQEMEKMNEEFQKIADEADNWSGAMGRAFDGWATDYSRTLNDMLWESEITFDGILESFGRMITQMVIQQSMKGIVGNLGTLILSAHGNVFSGPGIAAYENRILDRPTVIPLAQGAALVAEAGRSEAVMPLTRTSGGDLGVKAATAAPSVEINFRNESGVELQPETRIIRPSMGKMIANVTLKRKVNSRSYRQGMGVSR